MQSSLYSEFFNFALIFLGLALTVYAIAKQSPVDELRKTGVETEGIVFGQDHTKYQDGQPVNDLITVRFITENKEWITAVMNQPFMQFYWNQYKKGETVKLFYDRNNPSNFFVDTKQSELFVRVSFGIAGLVVCATGIYLSFFA